LYQLESDADRKSGVVGNRRRRRRRRVLRRTTWTKRREGSIRLRVVESSTDWLAQEPGELQLLPLSVGAEEPLDVGFVHRQQRRQQTRTQRAQPSLKDRQSG
jgi:hypothetical protein